MWFTYKAVTSEGEAISDRVQANDEANALRILAAEGKKVIEINSASKGKSRLMVLNQALSLDEQARFFEDAAILLNAGMSADQAFRAMESVAGTKRLSSGLSVVLDEIASGLSPSQALEKSEMFGTDVVALVASGESVSGLGKVFSALAKELAARSALRVKMVDTLSYPSFLVLLVICSVLLIAFALVPALMPIFEATSADLPLVMQILAGLRMSMLDYGLVLLGLIGAILLFVILPPTRNVIRTFRYPLVLKMPVVGSIAKQLALARYLRCLSLLISNNVKMPIALMLSADVVGVPGFQGALHGAVKDVTAGARLPKALADTGLFGQDIIAILRIGDDVNRLGLVSSRSADLLQNKAQRQIDLSLGLLTPAITIGMGFLIGLLVVTVMTTLLSVNELVIT